VGGSLADEDVDAGGDERTVGTASIRFTSGA
jgi:hypothetical protein